MIARAAIVARFDTVSIAVINMMTQSSWGKKGLI